MRGGREENVFPIFSDIFRELYARFMSIVSRRHNFNDLPEILQTYSRVIKNFSLEKKVRNTLFFFNFSIFLFAACNKHIIFILASFYEWFNGKSRNKTQNYRNNNFITRKN